MANWTEPDARCGWWSRLEVTELRSDVAADFITTELLISDFPYRTRLNVHT
jgi:hypothetical protein